MSNRNMDTYRYGEIFSTAMLSEGDSSPTQSNVWAAFGITDPKKEPEGDPEGDPKKKPEDDPTEDPAKDPEGDPKKDPEDPNKDPKDPDKDPEDPKKDPPPDAKAAAEFARMRVELKKSTGLLAEVAKVLGVTADDPAKMMTELQNKVIAAQSKQSGIPEEVLKQLRENNEELTNLKQDQIRAQAFVGFQKVLDTYKLTQKQLSDFADELTADNMNPFATPMDLVQEYRNRHWEEILQAEREAAKQEEIARAAKAAAHSTQPTKKDGKSPGEPEKIDTVNGLTEWLNSKK